MKFNYDDIKNSKRRWLYDISYDWYIEDNGELVFYCIDYRYHNVSADVRRIAKISEVEEYGIINVYDIMLDKRNFEKAKEVAEIMLKEWAVNNKGICIDG